MSSMSSNKVCDKSTKRTLPMKVLVRRSAMAQGPLEIMQVYKLLRWVDKSDKEKVEKMVHVGVFDLINLTEPKDGFSALHMVSANNDLDMARFLLSLGAHPDIQDKNGQTAMMQAAGLGHVQMVELLASHKASMTTQDAEGRGLLFYCIGATKMPLLEMALDLGADINNVSNAGKSVLLFACEQATDCENICLRLLEKGADPNIADPETGSTPLMEAVKAESVALVREILQRGGDPNAVDRNKINAAHLAASKGLFEVLRMLSAYSTNFHLATTRGDTPLHVAAAEGHAECCRFLIQRGCAVMRNKQGLLPIEIAKVSQKKAALKELKKSAQPSKPGESAPFHRARLHDWSLEHQSALTRAFQTAEKRQDSPVETVSMDAFVSVLQEHRAPVDHVTLQRVAGELAGTKDHIKIRDFFLGSTFLPKNYELSSYKSVKRTGKKDKERAEASRSPLGTDAVPPDAAETTGDAETSPITRDYFRAERSKDPSSYIDEPVEVYVNISECVRTDDYESLELAFSQNVPVDVRDHYYKTPLMNACIKGNYSMAQFLISKKANVNAYDQLKWTSLHHACFKGHADIVKLLLEHGAVVDAATTNKVTPLIRAIQSCRPECVKLLVEAGADVNAANMRGQNCKLLAQMYGNRIICESVNNELERRAALKKKPTPAPPAAKKDAALKKERTGMRRCIVGLKPHAADHCVTLPSPTISGEKVPKYRQLKERMQERFNQFLAENKLAISLRHGNTIRTPKPPSNRR